MSARAIKKIYGNNPAPKNHVEDESDDSNEEDIVVAPKKNVANAFNLLALEDENADEEEPSTNEQSQNNEAQSAPTKTTKKKNAKKSKKKKAANKKEQPPKVDDNDIPEEFLVQPAPSPAEDVATAKVLTMEALLSVDTAHLKAENELKRLFGAKTVMMEEKKNARTNRRPVNPKKALLLTPKDTWPNIPTGITMEFVEAKKGINYFRMKWSNTYSEAQKMYFDAVNTHSPHAIARVLAFYPYHVDSLVQLSGVCKQTGDNTQAVELVEMAIHVFQQSFHQLFNLTQGNSRLPFEYSENRSFFMALFQYTQMLGRKGCSRTAFEYCKLLLSLDPSDPCFVVIIIDHFALRARQYHYLLHFFVHFGDSPLATLPNFAYSAALALFHIEREKSSGTTTTSTSTTSTASNANSGLLSDIPKALANTTSSELLQKALLMFPMVLPELAKKASLKFMDRDPRTNTSIDLANHHFFTSPQYNPPSLVHLVTLFVERNATLWKAQEVADWLKANVKIVLKMVEEKDPMVEQCLNEVKKYYNDSAGNIYNHLLMSDYTDTITTLPPDVAEGLRAGLANMYEDYAPPPPPTVHASTSNPLALFLQTLMPWNPVPNAPLDPNNLPQTEAGLAAYLDQIMEAIAARAAQENPNDNPDGGDENQNR